MSINSTRSIGPINEVNVEQPLTLICHICFGKAFSIHPQFFYIALTYMAFVKHSLAMKKLIYSAMVFSMTYAAFGVKLITEEEVEARIQAMGDAFVVTKNVYGGPATINCKDFTLVRSFFEQIIEYCSDNGIDSCIPVCLDKKFDDKAFFEISRDPSGDEIEIYSEAYNSTDNIRIIDFQSILSSYKNGQFLEYGRSLINDSNLLMDEFFHLIDNAECIARTQSKYWILDYIPKHETISQYKAFLKSLITINSIKKEAVRQILALAIILNNESSIYFRVPINFLDSHHGEGSGISIAECKGFNTMDTLCHELIHLIHHRLKIDAAITFPLASQKSFALFNNIFILTEKANQLIADVLQEISNFSLEQLKSLIELDILDSENIIPSWSIYMIIDNIDSITNKELLESIENILISIILNRTWDTEEEIFTILGIAFYRDCMFLSKICNLTIMNNSIPFGHNTYQTISMLPDQEDNPAKQFWYNAKKKIAESKEQCQIPDFKHIASLCKIYGGPEPKQLLTVDELCNMLKELNDFGALDI